MKQKNSTSEETTEPFKLGFRVAPEEQRLVANLRGRAAHSDVFADSKLRLRASARNCDEDAGEGEDGGRRKGKGRRNQSKKKNGNSGDLTREERRKARRAKRAKAEEKLKVVEQKHKYSNKVYI